MEFIFGWILSFLVDHWVGVLIVLMCVGIAIRIFYYASNPIAVFLDLSAFLQKYWKETAIAIVILGFAAFVVKQNLTIKEQRHQLEVAEININTLKQNNAKLEETISESNKLIERFDQFSEETRRHFGTLNKDVSANNKTLTQQIQTILKEKKPQTCEEAMSYLIDARKGYVK